MIALTGCPGPPPNPTPTATPTKSPTSTPTPTRPDTSHDPAQAKKAGAPGVDAPWEAGDYEAFAAYVRRLPPEVGYPRFDSARSRRLLERFEQVRMDSDLARSLRTYMACTQVMKLYTAKGMPATEYSPDLARIFVVLMDAAAQMLPVVEAFQKTLDPKTDPNYATRMNGLKRMRGGIKTTLTGGIAMMEDISLATVADRAVVARGLERHAPTLIRRLDADQRAALKRTLDAALRRGLESPLQAPLLVLAKDSCWGG